MTLPLVERRGSITVLPYYPGPWLLLSMQKTATSKNNFEFHIDRLNFEKVSKQVLVSTRTGKIVNRHTLKQFSTAYR